jgi:rhodanese-related sulfurtransferase
MRPIKLLIAVLATLLLAAPVVAEEFPLRAKYPEVRPINIDDLAAQYAETIIIDVRSEMEFDTIHVSGAKHVPVTRNDFLSELEKLRGKQSGAPIAFYCNGHSCAKSYKAAAKAMAAGFTDIFCFDAGIFEWVDAYPERGTLLGQSPADKSKLIPKSKLDEHKIDFAAFKAKAGEPNSIILDTRDPFQRLKDSDLDQSKTVILDNIRSIPMDRMVKLVGQKEFADKQLLIFDAVGKQVRWLQYYLEDAGYRDYYFLEKGVLTAAVAGAVR